MSHPKETILCKFHEERAKRHAYSANALNIHSLTIPAKTDYLDDPEHLALTNRCRRLLLEAGADPTITPGNGSDYSFLTSTLHTGKTVVIEFPNMEMSSLTWEKESLLLLFNQGREFIATSSVTEPESLLRLRLLSGCWTVEDIALLLRLQESAALPPQDFTSCLHFALCGGVYEGPEGLTNVLILLIEAGADIYAKDQSGDSASDIACTAAKRWCDGTAKQWCDGSISGFLYRHNYDLRLKEIWVNALTACGYNAEEVISSSMRIEELSDTDDDSVQAQAREPSSDGPDYFAVEDLNDMPRLSHDICDRTSQSESDHTSRLPDSAFYSHSDWSLLEEEANVWRS